MTRIIDEKAFADNKIKRCHQVGITSQEHRLPTTTREELLILIQVLNNESSIHGILVQLPLLVQINE